MVNPESPKNDTQSITFRLENSVLDALRKNAENRRTTLNSIVKDILKEYLQWHSIAPIAGFLPINRALIFKLFQKYSEEEIIDIADSVAKSTTKEIMLLVKGKYDIYSALELIENRMKVSNFNYKHTVDDTTHSLVIQHNMGNKWSIYLGSLFKATLEQFHPTKVEIEFAENTFVLKVHVEKPSIFGDKIRSLIVAIYIMTEFQDFSLDSLV